MNSETNGGPEGLSLSAEERLMVEQMGELETIWNNPIFGGVLTATFQEISNDLLTTSPNEEKTREQLFWKYKGVEALAEAFLTRIQKGKSALEQLQRHADTKMQRIDTEEEDEIC